MTEPEEQLTRTTALKIHKDLAEQFPATLENAGEMRIITLENAVAMLLCSVEGDIRTKRLVDIFSEGLKYKVNLIKELAKGLENTSQ